MTYSQADHASGAAHGDAISGVFVARARSTPAGDAGVDAGPADAVDDAGGVDAIP